MNNKKGNKFAEFMGSTMLYVGRLMTVAIIIFSLAYALHYAQNSSYGSQRFAIRHVELAGIEHADLAALDALVRRSLPANLLQADLDQIRDIVESEPWVKAANVRRLLPDRLVITVDERQPAAVATIDGEFYLVDAEGKVLDRHGTRHHSIDGPIVKGLINVARENAREDNQARMAAYLAVISDFRTAPEDLLSYISEINVENPRRVALIPTDEPIPIFVGDHAFLQHYRKFLESRRVFDELKRQYGTIEYVDVTFEDKIIFHRPQDQQALVRHKAEF